MPRYEQLLVELRKVFPSPVSDPVHDGYVVFSLLRTLDRVDQLKTQAPILGTPRENDFTAAQEARLEAEGRTLEEVIPELVDSLRGMLIFGHPRSQVNVVSWPSIAGILGVVLPAMYNPNLCSEESGLGFSEVEVRAVSMAAELVGYHPAAAGGLFTFGGTGTLLYGLKLGLEKAFPDSLRRGVRGEGVILCSDQSHYACRTVAGWLGLGTEAVRQAPTAPDNSVIPSELEQLARKELAAGKSIVALVATLGTTDAFGLDDLAAVAEIARKLQAEFNLPYRPHVHADAVIGWAWSAFHGYDFTANPLGFRGRTLRALAGIYRRVRELALADTLGIDFHKTGFAPYISSLFLCRDREELGRLVRARDTMPYLYHSGEYHPGMYTLETSRSATGPLAALANLLLLGRKGLQVLLGHAVEMAELLREQIRARPELTVANGENLGPVTLFRAYPDGVDTFSILNQELHSPAMREQVLRHNEFNRRIYRKVHDDALRGNGVAIGMTDRYREAACGEPLTALKSYVLSPFCDPEQMHTVVRRVLEVRTEVQREFA